MAAGRPKKADPGSLYAFAHQLYWDFRRLSEGGFRRRFDENKFLSLSEELNDVPLVDDADRTRHQAIVNEEIRTGRLKVSERDERLQHIADSELSVRRDVYMREAAQEARKEIKVRAEPEVIDVLLNTATSPEDIRELCKEAFMTGTVKVGPETREIETPAWPIPQDSALPVCLVKHAEQYVQALRDPRFPRCDVSARPSTRLKQFWFLSRALSGAVFGVTPRTAINLVGSLRPEQVFEESRSAKRPRQQRKVKE